MRGAARSLLVAVVIIGGTELLLRWFNVPQYILPTPSLIATALVTEFPLIAPHLGYTLVELVVRLRHRRLGRLRPGRR